MEDDFALRLNILTPLSDLKDCRNLTFELNVKDKNMKNLWMFISQQGLRDEWI